MLKKSLFVFILIFLLRPLSSTAWEGKVIGIRDCSTIIVFDGTKPPVTVLLSGAEHKTCPREAMRFVAKSAFGKKVEIKDERKVDAYVAAEVIMSDGKSLNKELLKQDFMHHMEEETPVAVSLKTPETTSFSSQPQNHEPDKSASQGSRSASEQYPEPSPVPGVRKWRDEAGNIHFSGTVGGEK